MKFNKNPSNRDEFVRADRGTDRRIDMTRLVAVLSNFANAPNRTQ